MLAIAAYSLSAPSETFIRNHVRTLAPSQTILLCQDGKGTKVLGCPVLSNIDPWHAPRTFHQRMVHAVHHRFRLYIDPSLRNVQRRRAVSFLKGHKATAMLAEFGPMGCLLTGVCRDADISLYVHFHGHDASKLVRDRRQRRHYRRLFRVAAGIIAPSRFLAGELAAIGCPCEKLHVSPCGIDPRQFRPSKGLPGHILAVGRLVEKKAPHLTIEAFGRIAKRFPEARLDMIGDGPLWERCDALVSGLGLQDRIHLHGVQDSDVVVTMMQRASLFVQHSVTAEDGDTEGMPVAILEAMASALPVVSTLHSGIPEAVEQGITGVLVREQDVDGMAEAMAELLADPAKAAAMGAVGRSRVVERFTIDHTRDRLRAIMGLSGTLPAAAA